MNTAPKKTIQIAAIVYTMYFLKYSHNYEDKLALSEVENMTRGMLRPQSDWHIAPSFTHINEIMRDIE